MNDFDTSSAAASAATSAYAAHTATAPSGRRVHPDLAGRARVIALDHAASLSLPADRHDRALQLVTGELWLTNTRRDMAPARPRDGAGQIDAASADVAQRDPSDIWLTAGDSLHLPAGSHWVLQAWPEARMNLTTAGVGITNHVRPGTAATGSGSSSGLGWMQRLVAATHHAWRHHTRQPSAQAGAGLTGAGCS